jgi:hypothetical protein
MAPAGVWAGEPAGDTGGQTNDGVIGGTVEDW